MCRNLTAFERVVRVLIGLAIIVVALGFQPPHPWLALIALIPIGTAIFGYCPLYQLIGRNPLKRAAP
jgi:hypothetical protein